MAARNKGVAMKRAAGWILSAALLVRLLLAFCTGFGGQRGWIPAYNDEPAHFNYVRHLALTGKLPVQRSSVQEALADGEYEYYQAPLYYYLAQPFYSLSRWISPQNSDSVFPRRVFWVRCMSVLFSLGGLLVIHAAVRAVFGDADTALLVLILGSFGGIPLRFGSLVTNDSLLFALASVYAALILLTLHSGCDLRMMSAGILAAVAGLWTKTSFLLIFPLFPLALLVAPFPASEALPPQGNFARTRIWKAAVSFLIPLAALAPWFLRNSRLYGAWLPLEVGFGPPQLLTAAEWNSRLLLTLNYFARSLVFPFDDFWGGRLDFIIYPLTGMLFLVLLAAGWRSLRKFRRDFALFALAAILLNFAGYIYLNIRYVQAEARYFLPAFPFLLICLALGAQTLSRNHTTALLWACLWVGSPWLTLLAR
jgi:hypothetical protein